MGNLSVDQEGEFTQFGSRVRNVFVCLWPGRTNYFKGDTVCIYTVLTERGGTAVKRDSIIFSHPWQLPVNYFRATVGLQEAQSLQTCQVLERCATFFFGNLSHPVTQPCLTVESQYLEM